jgi:hypothetical protein
MTIETKYGADIMKQTQEVAELVKSMMPKITTNATGYEIRTRVLELAMTQVWQDYQFQSENTNNNPAVPSTQDILDTAEQFYNFINSK